MKIAICIPVYGDPKGKFTQSLCDMLIHFMGANITDAEGAPIERDVRVFMVSCSMLTESRHRLVMEAMMWDADYMLFLDADHTFPCDLLARLWSSNEAVIGVNYARRCTPTAPTAAKAVKEGEDKVLVYTTREKAEAGEIEEVDHLGFGAVLLDMRIFNVLQAKAEEAGEKSMLPLFKFDVAENGIGVIGEDVWFFKKVRDAGIKVFCDHGLSWEIGHLHDQIMTNAHAVAQRTRWDEVHKEAKKRVDDRAAEIEKAAA